MQSAFCSSLILMKLEFSRKIFEKYANIKFYEKQLSESRVVPYGQMDRWASCDVRLRHFLLKYCWLY